MQKNVLITGCSSGIGLAAANDLLMRGYRVLAACRKEADVARMEALGFCGIQLDLDDEASVARAAEQVIALTGNRLYGLFNNAGYGVYGPLESLSRRQLEQQFASNLFGTHQLTMLLLPALRASGWKAGLKPIPGDGNPVFGELKKAPGCFVAFTHSGATLALIAGELLADEIISGEPHPMFATFRAERFSQA